MPEEIFDVVNERDEIIDARPRGEVHRLGLLHRAVHILVFNHAGEIFLQKRSLSKDTHPGCWDSSCSGHVDHGEDYDESARRELDEELGISIDSGLERLFKIDAGPETDQEFVWIYRLQHAGPFVLHPEEIETGDWFAPERVTDWIAERPEDFASGFRALWTKLNSGA